MRIMSFADYKLERHSPVSFDPDLISPLLKAALLILSTRESHEFLERHADR